jgi:3-oxoacyl-[acyl-carrier protein] reductase
MSREAGMTPGTELAGKVALVTGGARNIGRAICRALAAGGASVMVNANTSQNEAKHTVSMIKSAGGNAAFHIADVTDPAAVAKMVDATVKEFGRLDILVNNAAVRNETPFEDIKLEEWRRVIAIVLDGAFLCTQSCLPHLTRVRGGAIVNLGGLTARARHRRQGGHRGHDARAGARPRAAAHHRELRGPGHHRDRARAAGRAGASRRPARPAADRPSRRAPGDRGGGAHAVRAGRALHHRPDPPRERRRVHALIYARASSAHN